MRNNCKVTSWAGQLTRVWAGRRPSQGGDERAQAAIGCPLGEDGMLVPVCKPDGLLAQDGGHGRRLISTLAEHE